MNLRGHSSQMYAHLFHQQYATIMLNACLSLCFSHTVKDTSFPGELRATKVKEFIDIMGEKQNKTKQKHKESTRKCSWRTVGKEILHSMSHEWVEDCERCHDWGECRPEGLWRNEKGDVGNVRLCRTLTLSYSSGSHQDVQQGEHYPNFRFCWRKLGGARKSEKVRVVKTGNCCVHQATQRLDPPGKESTDTSGTAE